MRPGAQIFRKPSSPSKEPPTASFVKCNETPPFASVTPGGITKEAAQPGSPAPHTATLRPGRNALVRLSFTQKLKVYGVGTEMCGQVTFLTQFQSAQAGMH